MIAMTGVPVWVLVVAMVLTYVVTALVYRRRAPCGFGCEKEILAYEKEIKKLKRKLLLGEEYRSEEYRKIWHYTNRIEDLNRENKRLLEENNRVIKRNRELKRVFGINADAIKYIVLKGEKLDIMGE